jgi:hypothetical protein
MSSTDAEPDYRERIRQRLEQLYGSPPRYRYFQRGNGPMFFWTVEPVNANGKRRYQSGVYKPVGKGSRSGKAAVWEIDRDTTSAHKLRKDAKERALRLCLEHVESEDAG